jgi:hypothetical protein
MFVASGMSHRQTLHQWKQLIRRDGGKSKVTLSEFDLTEDDEINK